MNIFSRINRRFWNWIKISDINGYETRDDYYFLARLEGIDHEQAEDFADLCYIKNQILPFPLPNQPITI